MIPRLPVCLAPIFASLSAAASLGVVLPGQATAADPQLRRPNVVLMMADDMGVEPPGQWRLGSITVRPLATDAE